MSCRAPLFFQRVLASIAPSLTALAIAFLGSLSTANAGGPLSVYGTVDPNDPFYLDINDQLFPGGGSAPDKLPGYTRTLPMAESLLSTPQMQPFGVGYTLTGGYRPIYSGAVQPTGHQIIETHGGNGYVYRPTYDYGNEPYGTGYGYRYPGTTQVVGSSGRAFVASNPGTVYETRYGSSYGRAAVVNVPQQGYMAAYGAGYYGAADYGYADYLAAPFYGVQTSTRAVETYVAPQQAPLQRQPRLAPEPGPRPKSLEELPQPRREF